MSPSRFLLAMAVACLAALAGVTMLQDHLLYFPARATVDDLVSAQLRAWPTAQAYRGLVAEPAGRARGTAVVFHGNAGHAGHRTFYADALVRQGLRVVLAEYPGYGPRGGDLGERSLVEDAQQTIAVAHQLHGPPLLLVGESLGAAVAAAAAARLPADTPAGLLLITPWNRLGAVAAHHYPFLPVKWLLRDRYDSVAHLARFRHPVLIAVAERDGIVPARFGIALHAALTGPKKLVVIEAAGHNDWVTQVDDAWWREVTAFALNAAPAR